MLILPTVICMYDSFFRPKRKEQPKTKKEFVTNRINSLVTYMNKGCTKIVYQGVVATP